MFANPIWSLLLLAAVIALYWIVIRPRLKVAYSETYLQIDSWWQRQLTRIYQFRSYVATLIASLMVAVPDILTAILPVDFTAFIGADYAKMVAAGLAAFLAINNAFKTKPDGVKAT